MSVSAYFIIGLCILHKIKRLSFTCTYHKSERITNQTKKQVNKIKKYKPVKRNLHCILGKKENCKKRILND